MDIDLDFGDRETILSCIQHVPAAMLRDGQLVRHVSGVYVNDIPRNSITQTAAIEYRTAEQLGYVKLDFLNVNLYRQIRDNTHLNELMLRPPPWARLKDSEFFGQLIHIGRHYNSMANMPEAINSIERMAMFLAIIRPGKKHLIGKTWREISETVWTAGTDSYVFKASHSYAYAHLVVVHMNLLDLAN